MCESMKPHQCSCWPRSCSTCLRADRAHGLAHKAMVRMIAAVKAGKRERAELLRVRSNKLEQAAVRC